MGNENLEQSRSLQSEKEVKKIYGGGCMLGLSQDAARKKELFEGK